jgi:hypothetical protein
LRRVIRIIRATDAIVVIATANETAPSNARVVVADARHVAGVKATHGPTAKASNATAAKATHVATAEPTHVSTAEATTHVTSAATTATASAGLCARSSKAEGKHRACHNHHNSSSHDILHWDGRTLPPQALPDIGAFSDADVAMDSK